MLAVGAEWSQLKPDCEPIEADMARSDTRKHHGTDGNAGFVRIIAGQWRGRRLPVPDLPGLRPSGDRGRETLFNWLQPWLPGVRCIDLFAGTGVLGLEALSRGASEAVLIEKNPLAVRAIRSSVTLLSATQAEVIEADAVQWLKNPQTHAADLVFVDPPFGLGLQQRVLDDLQQSDVLKPGGLVYVESGRNEPGFTPNSAWQTLKEKRLGEVFMLLLRKIT